MKPTYREVENLDKDGNVVSTSRAMIDPVETNKRVVAALADTLERVEFAAALDALAAAKKKAVSEVREAVGLVQQAMVLKRSADVDRHKRVAAERYSAGRKEISDAKARYRAAADALNKRGAELFTELAVYFEGPRMRLKGLGK